MVYWPRRGIKILATLLLATLVYESCTKNSALRCIYAYTHRVHDVIFASTVDKQHADWYKLSTIVLFPVIQNLANKMPSD